MSGNKLYPCTASFKGYYSEDYRRFYITSSEMVEFDISLFGYTDTEIEEDFDIAIEYTPAYGGSIAYPRDTSNPKGAGYGMKYYPFVSGLFGRRIFKASQEGVNTDIKKENNGIYKIYDKKHSRLGTVYLEVKIP